MNKNEYRIGNIVETCTPNMEIMIPIIPMKIQGITIFGELMFGYEPTTDLGFKMLPKHTKGIIITPELLLKNGFKKNNSNFILGNIGVAYLNMPYDEKIFHENPNYWVTVLIDPIGHISPIGRQLKYFHELQNFTFEISRIELDKI